MKTDTSIFKIVVSILSAIASVVVAIWGTKTYDNHMYNEQNAQIAFQIYNVLNANNANLVEASDPDDLESSMSTLIDVYTREVEKNGNNSQEISSLQQNIETLNAENDSLRTENEKLKAFLLKDNTYAESIDDLVIVKETSAKLEDLYVVDSVRYEVVDGFKDLYGDSHSVSYKLSAYDTAWVEYRLNGEYDIFNANIATTQETDRDTQMSVEVYVDGQLIKRVDDITRDTSLIELGPIVVTDGNILQIKVIKLEGRYSGICYITDDSLSTVQ